MSQKHFRLDNYDYCSRTIYMLTYTIEGRRQILGRLEGDPRLPNGSPGSAHLVPSILGEAITEEWKKIPALFPQVKNMMLQLMPDHLHTIIFVEHPLPKNRPLGKVMGIFRAHCNSRYKSLIAEGKLPPIPEYILQEQATAKREKRDASMGILFEVGFNDNILWEHGELQNWIQYLADNPRRRMLKELNHDLFRVKHNIKAGGFTFEAMGNEFLLTRPRRLLVQCSRRMTDKDIEALIANLCMDFQAQTVFISACISQGEKKVMRKAFENNCPVVVLRENGFSQYEKPGGQAFDACADGRMLLLAPWDYHNDKKTITREQCLMLNGMGEALSTGRAG